MKKIAWLLILTAGILWGSMGLFVDSLTSFGFTTLQAAALRICSATVMYVIFLTVKGKEYFKIKLCDCPVFFGLGVLSILAMTCFYFVAIQNTSYSVAATLLYTAPIMVSVMSAFLFKEKFTLKKITALIIAFSGCVLVSGLGIGDGIKPMGVVFGLLSGFAYSLYSIFGTIALKKFSPYTVSVYAFVFASVGAIAICDIWGILEVVLTFPDFSSFISRTLLTGLITAFLPFLLYTLGLKFTSPSKASIIACVEPLAATVFGLLKGQNLTYASLAGIMFILLAVVIINLPSQKSN